MKNKAYLVKKLCDLKGLELDSKEAQDFYSMKVIDLMIEIKKARPGEPEPEPEPQQVDKEDEEEFLTLAQRLGCS